MSLPANYTINYYRGDTYTLYIRPKDQAGNNIALDGFLAMFTAADKRGAGGTSIDFEAIADTADDIIKCKITPSVGSLLSQSNTYYYDVQITHSVSGEVFTYLTGPLIVTDDISGAN